MVTNRSSRSEVGTHVCAAFLGRSKSVVQSQSYKMESSQTNGKDSVKSSDHTQSINGQKFHSTYQDKTNQDETRSSRSDSCSSDEDETDYGDQRFAKIIKRKMAPFQKKLNRLEKMELFVLDNSMRETTVGAFRAHTVESKRAILDEIKKSGFKYFIIESFNHETRIGDLFLEDLIAQGEDLSNAFAFSELWEKIEDEIPKPDIPIGLKKCLQFGIKNVFLEFDLMYYKIDYKRFGIDNVCAYIKNTLDWIRSNLSKDSKILLNFRDFSQTMENHPERVYHVVNFLSSLPKDERMFGLAFEDLGKVLPESLGAWTHAVRKEMKRCGWRNGHLLFHQHEQWGLMHAANLEVLANGATGMWAGLCREGAAMGHADTCTAILNLIRLGNKSVQKQYDCKYLRTAAMRVTEIVTGLQPWPKLPVYGERSLDLVFGFLFSDPTAQGGFNMAEFLGIEKEVRISNMANPEMILMKLNSEFGDNPDFTLDMASKMKAQMLQNAADGRHEEYNSKVGLAMLFAQGGGTLTAEMAKLIEEDQAVSLNIKHLIDEIKTEWDSWDGRDGSPDDQLTFWDFYKGFMAPYFGCYKCEDTKTGLAAIDMDKDGLIDWFEFRTFLVWAGRQNPRTKTAQELLDYAFRKGLIPSMYNQMTKFKATGAQTNGISSTNGSVN